MRTTQKSQLILAILCFLILQACGGGGNQSSNIGGPAQTTGGSEKLAPFNGLADIELLTPTQGVGIKPKFEWSPVDRAARYALSLRFSDGQPYWAWSGSSTSVYLGGLDSPPPDSAEGPILLDGMSWGVIAFDAGGNVIASSVYRDISP